MLHVPPLTAVVQSTQLSPARPHCASSKPAWQLPPVSQHPWQLSDPHPGPPSAVVHSCFSQVKPDKRQFVQLSPAVPHARLVMPCWQTPDPDSSQQPEGHVVLSQTGGHTALPHPASAAWREHAWSTQCLPERVQLWHTESPVPQSSSDVPG
jgi:hypothetical protein